MSLKNIFQFILLATTSLSLSAQSMQEVVDLYNEGVESVQNQDYKSALESFENCIDMAEEAGEEAEEHMLNAQNNLPGVQWKIATGLLKEKKFDEGIKALNKTIKYAKDVADEGTVSKAEGQLPRAHYYQARVLSKEAKYTEAEQYYSKALELDPDYALVYVGRALMYRKMGKTNKELATVLKQGREVANRTNNVKAKKEVLKVAKIFLKYGNEYFKAAKYAECIDALNTYLEFNSKSDVSYYLLAKAYNAKSNSLKAIEAGNKALSLSKGGAEDKAKVYYEIAIAQKAEGNNAAACASFKSASFGSYTEQAKYQIEHVLKCE